MNRKLPKIIEDIGFDFHWSEEKVWATIYCILTRFHNNMLF